MHVHRFPRPIGLCPRLIPGILLLLLLPAIPVVATADSGDEVEQLLQSPDAPFGVVFEIVERDGDALDWALPAVQDYVRRLRQRFPDIGLAVVSHGREEFALLQSRRADKPGLHQTVQALVEEDVPVVVCGTHASWLDKRPEDFPDYVEVAPAGPTAIRNYEAMGFRRIVIERP